MTLCFSAIVLFLSTLSLSPYYHYGYWLMLDSNMTVYQPVRNVISNFSWSVVWGGSSLLNQNLSWCMHSCIISWITIVLAFLRVCLGLLYNSTATVWVELCCSFDFWFEIILLRYTHPDVVALASIYAERITYKLCTIIVCLNASVHGSFCSYLFKLTIALVCGAWSIGF